jgi:polyhydroxyalkanoate synthase
MTDARQNPATVLSDAAELGTKMLTGSQLLQNIRDADVQIATTPKDLVWRQDKVSLYHFRPLAEQRIAVLC